ncbi:MAG: COG4223 family protein [Rhizobiaceae bacterium]
MTSRKTPPRRTGTGGRPQKIIDLEAKEVSGQESGAETKPERKQTASAAKTTQGKTAAAPKETDNSKSKPQEQKVSSASSEIFELSRHVPLVVAAIAGGVIALAGNGLINSLGSSSSQQDQVMAELSGKLEDSSTGIRAEISKVRQDAETRLADMDGVTNKLSQEMEAARKDFTELAARISASDTSNGQISDGMKALASRMDSAEKVLEGLAKNPNDAVNANTVQLETLRREIEKQAGDLQSMNEKLAGISAKADDLEADARKLEDATQEVRNIRETQASAEEERLRNATADALQNAHRDGQDISALLTPAKSMVTDTGTIEKLQGLAEKGIATNEDLISGFRLNLREILIAAGKEPEGLVGKFVANAMTLVTVKPAGPVAGDNPSAIASRIDAALVAGQFADAMKEWESLPQASKDVSQDWQMKLASRIEADKLLEQIVNSIKSEKTDSG